MNHYPVAADAVEMQVHRAHAADLGRDLHALDQLLAQRPLLVAVEVALVTFEHVVVGIEQEAADAEAKRTQARVEIEAGSSAEGRTITQVEKVSNEARPSLSAPKKIYNKEEISKKGE